jgi:hypothetical protein
VKKSGNKNLKNQVLTKTSFKEKVIGRANGRVLLEGQDLFQISYTPSSTDGITNSPIPVNQYTIYGDDSGIEIFWTTEEPVPEFDLTVQITDLEKVFITGDGEGIVDPN